MAPEIVEANANWLAGVVDSFGEIGIHKKNSSPTMYARFKSAYPDRLEAIRAALGSTAQVVGPRKPSGASKQQQYLLVLVGAQLVRLENMVAPRMRTAKKVKFETARAELRRLRSRLLLQAPYAVSSPQGPASA